MLVSCLNAIKHVNCYAQCQAKSKKKRKFKLSGTPIYCVFATIKAIS